MNDNTATGGNRLDGRRVLVTGGRGGIGAATARLAAAEGAATVIVADIEVDHDAPLLQELRDLGAEAFATRLDVADESSWRSALEEAGDRAGGLDVLVNNAGITHREGVLTTDLESWDRVIAVNQTGVFLGMKHGARLMMDGGGGAIVNIASFTAYTGYRAFSYAASKWAVRGMTLAAADELGPHGVRVNSVSPGFVATPLTVNAPKLVQSFAADAPVGRMCEPEDIAGAVVYLASDASSYICGQDLVVDGGFMANSLRHVRA